MIVSLFLGFYCSPCVISPLSVYQVSGCYFVIVIFAADSISSGWLRALPSVNDAAYVNDAIMLCASVPCVKYGLQPVLCFPLFSLLCRSSFTFLHSLSLTFVSSPFYPLNNILCGNYLPFTHCALASCHTVCVHVLCVSPVAYGRALTAPTPG